MPYLVGSNNTSSLNAGSSTSCSFPFFLIFSTLTTLFCGYIFESDFTILYTTSSLGTSSIWAFGSGFSSTYFISSIGISSIISCFLPSLIITFFLMIFSRGSFSGFGASSIGASSPGTSSWVTVSSKGTSS